MARVAAARAGRKTTKQNNKEPTEKPVRSPSHTALPLGQDEATHPLSACQRTDFEENKLNDETESQQEEKRNAGPQEQMRLILPEHKAANSAWAHSKRVRDRGDHERASERASETERS